MTDWIPVKERLPEEGIPVYAWSNGDGFIVMLHRGEWCVYPTLGVMEPPTHWQPLPAPPRSKDEG